MKVSDIDRLVGQKGQVVSLGNLLARADGPGRATWLDLPASPGVYAICLPGWQTRSFIADAGQAKHATLEDPNLLCDKRDRILSAAPTDILYIGKAGADTRTLRDRVCELARFGVGRASNHSGGEWLWQLDGIDEAQVHMWCCPRGKPESFECALLDRFQADHGDLPLANRIGGVLSPMAAG